MAMMLTALGLIISLSVPIESEYLGCYQETRISRVDNVLVGTYDPSTLTDALCTSGCEKWSYRYAGTTSGTVCFCTNTALNAVNKVVDASCAAIDTSFVKFYEVPMKVLNMALTADKGITSAAATGSTVTFTLTWDDAPTNVIFKVDFGEEDGQQTIPTPTSPYTFTRIYIVPGFFTVSVEASEGTIGSVMVALYEPISAAAFECPPRAATFNEVKCNGTIGFGSNLYSELDFGDGHIEAFYIADAHWFVAGRGVEKVGTITSSSVASTTYFNPASQFDENGLLVGFEYYAVASSGTINFLLLRSSCSSGSYCHTDNTCKASACAVGQSSCPSQPNSIIFCPQSSSCAASTSTSCSPVINRYNNKPDQLVYVSRFPVTIPSTGFNFYKVPSPVSVIPGDLVGIETLSAGGAVGTTALLPGEMADMKMATSGNSQDAISSFTSDTIRHLLRGVAHRESHFSFFHTYENIGVMNVVLKVTDADLPSTQTLSATIILAIGINDSTIFGPPFGNTSQQIRFDVLPHSGSNITYTWDVGDGTPIQTTDVPFLLFAFTTRGCYDVNVTSTNPISVKMSNKTNICIEDEVLNLRVLNSVSAATLPSNFDFSMSSGSDFICNWTYGDGSIERKDETITPITGFTVSHTYASDGTYNVEISCANNVSSAKVQLIQYVQWPIVNLRFDRVADAANVPFKIDAFIDQGTNPSFELIFNGVKKNVVYDATIKKISSVEFLKLNIGLYPVSIKAWNQFNNLSVLDNYTIEIPITNPAVECLTEETPSERPIPYQASVSNGSGITISWNFGDGNPHVRADPPNTLIPSSGLVDKFTHTFTYGNFFNISVTIKNAMASFNFTCVINVFGKIENVTLEGSTSASFLRNFGNVSFYFTSAQNLVNHFVTFDFGDGTTTSLLPFSTTRTYDYAYKKVGTYYLTANVSNKYAFGIYSRKIVVALQISNMGVVTKNPHAVVNVPFDVGVVLDNSDGVKVYFEYGDPSSGNLNEDSITRNPIGTSYIPDWMVHTYSQVGIYTITVRAENVIGNTTLTYLLSVQDPVPKTFAVVTDKVTLPPGLVYFNLTLPPGETLPTNATVTLFPGDGTSSLEIPLPFTTPPYLLALPYTYLVDGVFDAQILIKNLASNFTVNTKVGVYVPFSGFQITPKFASELNAGELGVPPLGPNQDTYPLTTPMIIETSFTAGKPDYFTIDIIDENGNVITIKQTEAPLTLDFVQLGLSPGKYKVSITAVNGIDSTSQSLDIVIANTLSKPEITSVQNASDPNQVDFKLSFKDASDGSCFAVDFGDGTFATFGLTPQSCSSTLYASWPFTPLPSLTSPLSLPPPPHRYPSTGTYQVNLKAIDFSGTYESTITCTVSQDKDCVAPELDIKNKAPNFVNPYLHERSAQLDVVASTNIICDKTLKNTKLWTVWVVDPSKGTEVRRLTFVDQYRTAVQAQLTVPELTLGYGLYKFTYNVTVLEENMYSVVSTYIRIVPSAIVAFLVPNGMSQISRTYGNDITISPESYSYDPDVEEGLPTNFTSFKWFCRQRDEVFPTLLNGSFSTTPLHKVFSAAQFAATGQQFRGGCFGTGPGALDFKNGTLIFPTSMMKANNSYVFSVIVTIGTRSSRAELRIDLIEGVLPSVVIGCQDPALCKPKTVKLRVNPNNRLTLYATCVEYCTPGSVYSWTASRLGLNGAWLRITEFASYVEAIESLNSEKIAFPITMFADGFRLFQDLTNYRFEVTLTPPPGSGEKGTAYIEVLINTWPKGGNCTISPEEGTSSMTKFDINCQGWEDEDGIKIYQFYAKSEEQPDMRIQIGLSESGSLKQFTLPPGPEAYAFNLSIFARILDTSYSAADYYVGVVEVKPMTLTESNVMVAGLLGNQTVANTMLSLAANGDIRQTSTIFLGIAETLNADSAYKTESASSIPSQDVYDPFMKTLSLEDNTAYQDERNRRAELKSTMIQALNNVTISDVLSIQLVASTMTFLTKVPSEINRADQKTMLDTMAYMRDTVIGIQKKVSLEELKIGSQSLMEAVGNMMENILYGQKDGTIADITEAKKDPLYFYDTDWESPREAFIDLPKDKMKRGLQSETNTLVQKETAKSSVPSLLEMATDINKVMLKKLSPGELPLNITSPTLSVTLVKDTPARLEGKPLKSGGAEVRIPSLCELTGNKNCSSKTSIGIEMISTPRNILNHLPTPLGVANYSGTVTLNIYDENGGLVDVKNLTEPIEIIIPRNFMPPIPRMIQNKSDIKFRDESTLLYYRFTVAPTDKSISVEIMPQNKSVQFLIFLRFNSYPMINNASNRGWDYMQNLPINISDFEKNVSSDALEKSYTVFVNSDVIQDRNGTWYVGIRQLQEQEYDSYSDLVTPSPLKAKTGEPSTNFSVLIYTSGCHYFKENDETWQTGCLVSPKTCTYQTVCLCTHLTSFAGGFIVQPNTIDFDFILKNADFMKNPTLYITEIVIAIVYILAFIWARWKDKKDVEKLGVTPLPDNDPNDKYLYEIIVSTGLRKNAGTKSKVHVIFSGDFEETSARTLEDEKRTVFKRGELDSFLMAVPRPLGALNYARVWHDNSGPGKYGSWYLNWLLVRDVQTGEKFHFIANEWLAVEEDDGQISRLIAVSGREQMVEMGHAFSKRATKGLSDDHIWFSIFSRPPQSRFTRVQRLSCCLCLLFTAMFANALFYGTTENTNSQGLEIGPFTITPEQIYVGFISNIIVFPINFLIAFLFKKSRPRAKRSSRITEAVKKIKEQNREHMAASNIDMSSLAGDKRPILDQDYGVGKAYCDPLDPGNPKTYGSAYEKQVWNVPPEDSFPDDRMKKKKKKKFELPWWCIIIGWILLWLTVAGCVAGVTFYGIMFQDAKSRKWISSMMISFLTSVLLTQPIKVVFLALLFSMIFKKPTEEEEDYGDEDEENPNLEYDEDWLHTTGPPKARTIIYQPPDPKMLERARERRLKEIEMYAVIREILFYAFFMWVLITVSYDFRDVNSYDYKTTLLTKFVSGGTGSPNPGNSIDLVRTMDDLWSWLLVTFSPGIRVDNWYNGDPPLGLRGYLDDYVSRIMGFAMLRQLRVRPKLCTVSYGMRSVVKECNAPYSFSNEDKSDYGPGWIPLNGSGPLPEYRYRTSEELDGFPFLGTHEVYGGGGYLVELRGDRNAIVNKIVEIKDNGWIDRYTRAVFIEFATYNTQVNLFGVVHIVAELLTSGGFDCYYRFDTMNLIGSQGSSRIIQYVLQGLFCLCIVIFLVKEIRNIMKQKKSYFTQYWNWLEWWIIVCSIVAVAMYAYRAIMTNRLTKIFARSGGNSYMKFTGVAYWNEMLLYLLAILVFWANLKFLKLLRFNKTIGLLSSTLRYCSKSLINFSIMFGLVFFAFIHCFYLVYLPSLEVFSDLVRTSEQCFMMMVGKFNFSDMAKASPILGTLMFFLYMVIVFFILLTMFVGIISEAFSAVNDDIKKQSNDYEMVDFIVEKVKDWTGLSRYFKKKVKPGEVMDVSYDPRVVEALPDRLDKFLDSITKTHFNHDTFESLFKDGLSNPDGKSMMAGKNSLFASGTSDPPKKFDPNPKGRKGFPDIG